MPCMCGDTACPDCGPIQGYNAAFEKVCDEIIEAIPALADEPDTVEEIANLLWKKLDTQRESIAVYVANLGKCRLGITGAQPPVIENMTTWQVLDTIANALDEWSI